MAVAAPVNALATAAPRAPVTAVVPAMMIGVTTGPQTDQATALATAVPRGPVTAVMIGVTTAVTIGVPPAPVNALVPGAMPLVMIGVMTGAVTDPATAVTTAAPPTRPKTAMADLRCGQKNVRAAGLFATTSATPSALLNAVPSARALHRVPLK